MYDKIYHTSTLIIKNETLEFWLFLKLVWYSCELGLVAMWEKQLSDNCKLEQWDSWKIDCRRVFIAPDFNSLIELECW